ncbi:UDP-glycosyltransferase UGT5-like [Onthophagus taurus]|uniref:UDP-glycosyltransferase UGT5-like n=1 Tax=Onthophagus taurus TaxID=166361 RepID=UPI0039BE6AB7
MLTFLLVLISFQQITCKNILYVDLVPSPSHHGWNEVLIEGLLSRNHNVTMIGYYDSKIKHPNYEVLQIDIKPFTHSVDAAFQQMSASGSASIKGTLGLAAYVENSCKYCLKTQQFKQLLDYPKDLFDMIIFDVIYAECYLPLIDHFGLPPVVAVTAFGMYSYINDVMGQTTENYIPYFALPYSDHMNFFERIHSSFYLTMESIIRLNNLKNLNDISKETFGPKSRSIEDLFKEISLMFPNDHPILDYPKPTAPNVIPIGGVQVKPPKKLDKDLQKILDDSKQGVIFVSLGSNFVPKYYGKHAIKSFKESFSKLNQTILWKFDDDDLPKNVITRKWFSQTDILAHPNTKLFITHCGGLSTQETIIRGVPVIGIPLFFDQYSQAGKIQSINGGVVLKYWELTTENVYNSILEVLSNPVYKNNMKRLSTLYNEQPENQLEKFLLWVDYVLKHGHLNHLSLGSREMRWYQVNNWDVYAFGVGVCLLFYILFNKLSCVILKMNTTERKEKIN